MSQSKSYICIDQRQRKTEDECSTETEKSGCDWMYQETINVWAPIGRNFFQWLITWTNISTSKSLVYQHRRYIKCIISWTRQMLLDLWLWKFFNVLYLWETCSCKGSLFGRKMCFQAKTVTVHNLKIPISALYLLKTIISN